MLLFTAFLFPVWFFFNNFYLDEININPWSYQPMTLKAIASIDEIMIREWRYLHLLFYCCPRSAGQMDSTIDHRMKALLRKWFSFRSLISFLDGSFLNSRKNLNMLLSWLVRWSVLRLVCRITDFHWLSCSFEDNGKKLVMLGATVSDSRPDLLWNLAGPTDWVCFRIRII